MIIEAEIGGHYIHRMCVDGGSSSKILYDHCFNRFHLEVKNQMIPKATPLVEFSGEIIWPLGKISLLVKIGDDEHSTSAWMNFMIVRSLSPYNGIIGRPGIRRIRPADMTGVPRHISEHRLNIHEGCLPIRQKKTGQAPERNKAICEEVEKLLDADIMKEVHYHSWLSNPVMDKAEAVLNLPFPKCLKDVQKLNGKLASLNRFLSKSAEKYFPFFKTLKNCIKKSDFQRTTEAEMAIKQMKRLIAELLMLTAPKEKEELIMYLAATKEAISAVLITKRDRKQNPIYFISRALQVPKRMTLRYANRGSERTSGPVDIIHGWIIMYRRLWSWLNNHESRSNRIHLCFEANVDSKLVANQVNEVYAAKEPGMTKYLDKAEEISHVLWSHCTMIKSSNEETSFSLTYGTEAVILVEIRMPTLRTAKVDMIKNDEALEVNLDLLEEKKEHAAIQEAKSKAKMEKYYNTRVRSISFRPRDLVYRSNKASRAEDGGKLRPKWEGPYEIMEALGKRAYKLRDRKVNTLPRT
nr:reverse transcriptase domain-containing protein [Tanacetum cinerariifolium]